MRPASLVLLLLVCLSPDLHAQAPAAAKPSLGTLEPAWQSLDAALPKASADFVKLDTRPVIAAARTLEATVASQLDAIRRQASPAPEPPAARPRLRARLRSAAASQKNSIVAAPVAAVAAQLEPLLAAKQRVDERFDALLALRGQFVAITPAENQRAALRNYLRTLSTLIDLSARLRYLQFDAIGQVAEAVSSNPGEQTRLIALLTKYKSSIGASVMVDLLFDPVSESGEPLPGASSEATKSAVLSLIAISRQSDALPELADYIFEEKITAALLVQAAETVRILGLPQEPRPGQDPTLPPVAVTANELRTRLSVLDPAKQHALVRPRLAALVEWLDQLIAKGVTADTYPLGLGDFAPGDWLLMRNPSPYNLFTDISPGLFTHVGVVAAETPADGLRRIVLVDLPERGSSMPATTVDTFIKRTRHYLVLRHSDPEVARKMGEAAAEMIGNKTQFDLNFRTRRVQDYVGKPLKGANIHTYCAGLLLLCALQTGHEREEFFPVAEFPAPGKTQANLKTFGMSIGEDFISPTGALFSDKFKIVARRESMYDPRREVEEAVFDHFAERMITTDIKPTADSFQSLRLKVAEASKTNPLLAKALASAANVNDDMDLVAAAKAAAVVETLDEVATRNSAEFLVAQQAMRAGDANAMRNAGMKPEEITRVQKLRQTHADLYRRWTSGGMKPRAMRIELVNYYINRGRQQIDQRFFAK